MTTKNAISAKLENLAYNAKEKMTNRFEKMFFSKKAENVANTVLFLFLGGLIIRLIVGAIFKV